MKYEDWSKREAEIPSDLFNQRAIGLEFLAHAFPAFAGDEHGVEEGMHVRAYGGGVFEIRII